MMPGMAMAEQQSTPGANHHTSLASLWFSSAEILGQACLPCLSLHVFLKDGDALTLTGRFVVCCRKPQLPRQYIPEMRAALKKIGRKWYPRHLDPTILFYACYNACSARTHHSMSAETL